MKGRILDSIFRLPRMQRYRESAMRLRLVEGSMRGSRCAAPQFYVRCPASCTSRMPQWGMRLIQLCDKAPEPQCCDTVQLGIWRGGRADERMGGRGHACQCSAAKQAMRAARSPTPAQVPGTGGQLQAVDRRVRRGQMCLSAADVCLDQTTPSLALLEGRGVGDVIRERAETSYPCWPLCWPVVPNAEQPLHVRVGLAVRTSYGPW